MNIEEAKKAIKGLNNIIEYWAYRPEEVATAKLAIEALEKQIAKKPIEFDDCPECGYCLMWHEKDWVNCPGCGQKIDWGKER